MGSKTMSGWLAFEAFKAGSAFENSLGSMPKLGGVEQSEIKDYAQKFKVSFMFVEGQ